MSRTTTRSDAVSKGATEGESEFGLGEWLAGLPPGQRREDRDLRHQDRHHALPARVRGLLGWICWGDDVEGDLAESQRDTWSGLHA
jgi:hypothetical protein